MKLPPELWDNIIQECQEEPATLSVCSLVCKSWMPESRRLLFKNKVVKPSDEGSQDFLRLLSDPKCTATVFIAALKLNYWTNYSSEFHDVADAFINRCTSLRSLTLCGRARTALSSLSSTSISSLRFLEISDSFDDWGSQPSVELGKFLNMVGSFSALEVLSLFLHPGATHFSGPVVPVYDREPPDQKGRRHLPRLRRLKLNVVWNAFIPWFLVPDPGIPHLPVVEEIELDLAIIPLPVQVALLQSFLDLYASTVKVLVLQIMCETVPALNLGRFSALRLILFDIQGAPDGIQKLVDIVSTCPNRNREDPLRAIITNEGVQPSTVEGVDWILDKTYYEQYASISSSR
ncbi:hypothetical protein PQX77_002877 [Marasmius sp. AFHP31]|nr:hypothetical protein PQX77_002877 [Marasmius sp. AFHP31]